MGSTKSGSRRGRPARSSSPRTSSGSGCRVIPRRTPERAGANVRTDRCTPCPRRASTTPISYSWTCEQQPAWRRRVPQAQPMAPGPSIAANAIVVGSVRNGLWSAMSACREEPDQETVALSSIGAVHYLSDPQGTRRCTLLRVDCISGIAAICNADSVVETDKIVHAEWSNGLPPSRTVIC